MQREGKIWGNTTCLFNKCNVSMHRLEVIANHCCSKHKHLYKYNMFFVESGMIDIKVWQENGIVDVTTLSAGQSCVVPPNKYHKFIVRENGVVFEMYWTELIEPDIIREDSGK